MEAMSPQQDHVGQGRSSSLTGGNRRSAAPEGKKVRELRRRVQNRPPGERNGKPAPSLGKRGGEDRLARFPSFLPLQVDGGRSVARFLGSQAGSLQPFPTPG